ncbi:MAG: hypothetical protein L3J62_08440 [Gammaproteobacteria bacterium]|nr:hypothetical protein [Gammaproteobacteria bacterium]MCF6230802.1 hypothetical protein [Gammaproteobacteria bacterium]
MRDGDVGRFIDAVALARDFLAQNPQLINIPVSVNPEITRIIIATTPFKKIKILETGTGVSKIAGMLLLTKPADSSINLLTDSEAIPTILLSPTSTKCWKRFAVCKELMHMYIEQDKKGLEERAHKFDGECIISNLQRISEAFWTIKKEDELNGEQFGFVVTMEVLLPWDSREQLDVMKKTPLSNYQIANEFKVPESIIARYFESGYDELSREANALYTPK